MFTLIIKNASSYILIFFISFVLFNGCATTKMWEKTKSENSIDAYKNFYYTNQHSGNEFVDSAKIELFKKIFINNKQPESLYTILISYKDPININYLSNGYIRSEIESYLKSDWTRMDPELIKVSDQLKDKVVAELNYENDIRRRTGDYLNDCRTKSKYYFMNMQEGHTVELEANNLVYYLNYDLLFFKNIKLSLDNKVLITNKNYYCVYNYSYYLLKQ